MAYLSWHVKQQLFVNNNGYGSTITVQFFYTYSKQRLSCRW